MRTLTVSIAFVALLAGSAAAAGQDTGGAHAWVTGSETCSTTTEGVETFDEEQRRLSVRGLRRDCEVTVDDPRLGGPAAIELDFDCVWVGGEAEGWSCVSSGSHRFSGPDGGWSGTFSGVNAPGGDSFFLVVAEGTAGYAGLSWIARVSPATDSAEIGVVGLIYEGPPPLSAAVPGE